MHILSINYYNKYKIRQVDSILMSSLRRHITAHALKVVTVTRGVATNPLQVA